MGFKNKAYATVWSVEEGKGNFYNVRISTSKKNKQTDEYEQDFSKFCSFVGKAREKAAQLKERDRIQLGDCEVFSRYDKEKSTEYLTFMVYDFEFVDVRPAASPAPEAKKTEKKTAFEELPEEGENNEKDEDLPF